MKKIGIIILLALIGCSVVEIKPMGMVEGKVSIGPLCGFAPDPVALAKGENPCGLTNEEIDGVYGRYTVVLSNTANSATLRKKLDRTGVFSFEVEEGNYTINLESSVPNALMFSAKNNIEKSIKVSNSQKVYIELSVNTGIPQNR